MRPIDIATKNSAPALDLFDFFKWFDVPAAKFFERCLRGAHKECLGQMLGPREIISNRPARAFIHAAWLRLSIRSFNGVSRKL